MVAGAGRGLTSLASMQAVSALLVRRAFLKLTCGYAMCSWAWKTGPTDREQGDAFCGRN